MECDLCGALLSHEFTHCPYCGTSRYALEVAAQDSSLPAAGQSLPDRLRFAIHSLLRIPYSAEQVFGDSLNPAVLYEDLIDLLDGNRFAAERLVAFEHLLVPSATRWACIRKAIQRLSPGVDPEPTGS
ncbi:MAG TPA: hypothetical protein VIU39_13585 [Anaerolineales bacterium]